MGVVIFDALLKAGFQDASNNNNLYFREPE